MIPRKLMRILFAQPGHLKTVPMRRYIVETLRELGHDVVGFDFHCTPVEKIHDRFCKAWPGVEEKSLMNRRFRRTVEAVQPDLMLTLFGFDLSEASLAQVRQLGIPSVCWWINDPFQFRRSLRKAGQYDFLFSNSAGSVVDYRAAGIKNAYFLPVGCFPPVHRTVPAEDQFRCDLCFAGDWSPLRENLLLPLAREFDVKIFGPWQKHLPAGSPLHSCLRNGFFTPEEMTRMFCSAKVVLNIHTWHETHTHGVNPRLFEAAGCGAFQVVDWKQEIPDLFDPQHELRCYRNHEELTRCVREAVTDDARRTAVQAAAQKRAYGEHTYRHRMQQLFEVLKEKA